MTVTVVPVTGGTTWISAEIDGVRRGGVRFGLPANITEGIEIAAPLTRALTPGEADSDGARIFFTLLGRF